MNLRPYLMLGFLFGLLVTPDGALALSCQPLDLPYADDVARLGQQSDVVFMGKFVDHGSPQLVEVERVWKGDLPATVLVRRGWSPHGSLFFASGPNQDSTYSRLECTHFDDETQALAALDEYFGPSREPSATLHQSALTWFAVVTFAAVALAIACFVWLQNEKLWR